LFANSTAGQVAGQAKAKPQEKVSVELEKRDPQAIILRWLCACVESIFPIIKV